MTIKAEKAQGIEAYRKTHLKGLESFGTFISSSSLIYFFPPLPPPPNSLVKYIAVNVCADSMWIYEAQCKDTQTERKLPEEARAVVVAETLAAASDKYMPSDRSLALK